MGGEEVGVGILFVFVFISLESFWSICGVGDHLGIRGHKFGIGVVLLFQMNCESFKLHFLFNCAQFTCLFGAHGQRCLLLGRAIGSAWRATKELRHQPRQEAAFRGRDLRLGVPAGRRRRMELGGTILKDLGRSSSFD